MERNFDALKRAEYRPFSKIECFSLLTAESGEVKFMAYADSQRSYYLEIKGGGYIPKSGLLLARSVEGFVYGKDVLDMCTGETGMIAIHSATFGAKSVHGIDIDEATVEWAQHNAELNNLLNTHFTTSNLFSEISAQFDIITTNPPQMPMVSGHFHDSGGPNGREIIEEIIRKAPEHLRPNGELYMLVFDFLGVEESFGKYSSLKDIFTESGFDMQIIDTFPRVIRKGGATEQSLAHINKHYPSYVFQQKGDNLVHEILIVKATLKTL